MNTLDLIVHLIKSVHLTDWAFTHNTASGKCTQAHIGALPGDLGLHAAFTFVEAGTTHTLTAERPFAGGSATVTLDGTAVVNGDMALAKHLRAFPPSLVAEIDISVPGNSAVADRYRFTSRVI